MLQVIFVELEVCTISEFMHVPHGEMVHLAMTVSLLKKILLWQVFVVCLLHKCFVFLILISECLLSMCFSPVIQCNWRGTLSIHWHVDGRTRV